MQFVKKQIQNNKKKLFQMNYKIKIKVHRLTSILVFNFFSISDQYSKKIILTIINLGCILTSKFY